MKTLLTIPLTLILLTSCKLTKEERRLNRGTKKLERLVTKFPELKRTDTLYIAHEVIVPRTQIDTITTLTTDTVTITKDRLTVRYRVDTVLNTVWLDAMCDTLVIRDTVAAPCPTIQGTKTVVRTEKRVPWWVWLIISGLSLAVLGLIFRR